MTEPPFAWTHLARIGFRFRDKLANIVDANEAKSMPVPLREDLTPLVAVLMVESIHVLGADSHLFAQRFRASRPKPFFGRAKLSGRFKDRDPFDREFAIANDACQIARLESVWHHDMIRCRIPVASLKQWPEFL